MGGLVKFFFFIYLMMVLGLFVLVGFFYFIGFYLKDVILEVVYVKYMLSGNFVYWLGIVLVLFIFYYLFRLFYLMFLVLF